MPLPTNLPTNHGDGDGGHTASHNTTNTRVNAVATEVNAHEAATTTVHGIADTSVLATATSVATAVSTHAAATDPHGDRSYADTAISTHSADTTSVHGIADTSALATSSSVTSAVAAHAAATDPHGDRAYADAQLVAGWGVGLPRVTITTTSGADPTTTETYLDATVTISGSLPYSGTTQIRGRGNSTWLEDKKPWRIKLVTTASLLGMPSERDWVLLANHMDPVKIRNAVAFELGARCTGLDWTPRMRWVELEMNGTYRGVYQLGEHVEISANKIAGTKATGTTGLGLTGLYSMEIDRRAVIDDGEPGFVTTHDIAVAYDDPDGANATQAAYIAGWIQDFEDVLYDDGLWLDPDDGYAQYIDRDSFVDWYMVNELMANLDSNGYSSIKITKTRDTANTPGRLVLGPLWDFDLSAGNDPFGDPQSATAPWVTGTAFGRPGFTWFVRLLADPTFFAALIERWATLRAAITTGDTVYAFVDRLIDRLTYATARDQRKWTTSDDVPDLADDLKAWLAARIAWLDTQWIVDTDDPSTPAGLSATPGDAQVFLNWSASTDNLAVTKYRVYRDGGGSPIAEPTGTSYTDTGRTNGVEYSYTVTAVDAAGNESAPSSADTATPDADGLPTVTTGTLVGHWRADAITGFSDGATLTGTWLDSSGGGHPLTVAGNPTYQTNEINGEPVVRLDGAGDYLSSATFSQAQPLTLFLVARRAAVAGASEVLLASDASTDVAVYLESDKDLGLWAGGGPLVGGNVGSAAHVLGVVLNGGSSELGLDGTIASGAAGANSLTGLFLGTNRTASGEYFTGDIAEIVAYSGALSTGDRSTVRTYLGTKYGITVTP